MRGTSRGFQEWQPTIQSVPYSYSTSHNNKQAVRDVPESMCNMVCQWLIREMKAVEQQDVPQQCWLLLGGMMVDKAEGKVMTMMWAGYCSHGIDVATGLLMKSRKGRKVERGRGKGAGKDGSSPRWRWKTATTMRSQWWQ